MPTAKMSAANESPETVNVPVTEEFPVMFAPPLEITIPAEPVIRLLNVLAPAKIWAIMLMNPRSVALASIAGPG